MARRSKSQRNLNEDEAEHSGSDKQARRSDNSKSGQRHNSVSDASPPRSFSVRSAGSQTSFRQGNKSITSPKSVTTPSKLKKQQQLVVDSPKANGADSEQTTETLQRTQSVGKKQKAKKQANGKEKQAKPWYRPKLWTVLFTSVLVSMALLVQQDNIRLDADHADLCFGSVNFTVPYPVDVSSITDMQEQLLTKFAALSTLINLSNGTLANTTNLLSDWLPALDTLVVNTSVVDTLGRLKNQLPTFGPSTDSAGAQPSVQRPGKVLAFKGYKPKHPVVIVPGFVTSQLELWQAQPCASRYFRQRMWGTMTMMQTYLRDSSCWFHHLALDPVTGLDPPGVKLRAATGLEAVDFFVQGYWVWHKLVEALADIGYDTNNIATAAYDWRLAVPLMETRDAWFTRTKRTIEMLTSVTGEKTVLVSHSYGESVTRTFIHWVEGHEPGWVEKNLHAHVAIAGTTLGVPKALTSLLSGEMRDTAQLGAMASFLTARMIPRQARAKLFRSWASVLAMFPQGGPKVWGNTTWAPDDTPAMRAANRTYGALITSAPLRPKFKQTAASQQGQCSSGSCDVSGSGARGMSEGSSADSLSAAVSSEPAVRSGEESSKNPQCAESSSMDAGHDNESQQQSCPSGFETEPEQGQDDHHGGNDSSQGLAAKAAADLQHASTNIVDSLRSWFTATDESTPAASGVIDPSQLRHMHVGQAIHAALKEAGPLMRQHYREWGAVHGPEAYIPPQKGNDEEDASNMKEHATEKEHLPPSIPLPLLPNPLTTPLPNTPKFKMFCLYGVGIPTERAYHYIHPEEWEGPSPGPKSGQDTTDDDDQKPAAGGASSGNTAMHESQAQGVPNSELQCNSSSSNNNSSQSVKPGNEASYEAVEGKYDWQINTALDDASVGLDSGILMQEGDLTVPLLSLGGMCRGGWRSKRLNPAGIQVTTKEYQHVEATTGTLLKDSRTPKSGSHVDILGNEEMLTDVLMIVSGADNQVEERLVSRIDSIVEQIPWEEPDGWDWA